jgi:hypothetical protein
MATIEGLEKKVKEVEGFDVKLMHRDGRDVHGKKEGRCPLPVYKKSARQTHG